MMDIYFCELGERERERENCGLGDRCASLGEFMPGKR